MPAGLLLAGYYPPAYYPPAYYPPVSRTAPIVALLLCISLPAQFFGERYRSVFVSPLQGTITCTFDVDGDGDQDIFSVEGTTGHIYSNDGHGRFAWLNSFAGNWTAQVPIAPSVGDVDGDGDLDFCIGTSIYSNQGNGSFLWSNPFPATLVQDNHQLIDFDGDGDLDYLLYIFAFPSTSGVHLFENDGTGQFVDVTNTVLAGLSTYAGYIEVVDIDSDGDSDVLLASDGLGPLTMQVWFNQGGSFISAVLPSPNMISVIANPHVGDLNGDSHPDISVWAYFQPVWIALNDGTGVFTPATPTGLVTPELLPHAALADWDGDGLGDFITQDGVYLQTQPLHFELQRFVNATIDGHIWITDLDGDLDLDAAAAGSSVIINTIDGPITAHRPPSFGHPLAALDNRLLDSRVSVGANPTTQILWEQLSEPKFFTDAVAAGNDPNRHLLEVPLPNDEPVDGAIVHNAAPHAATGVVITTSLGANYYELGAAGFTSVAALPAIAGHSSVAAANLDDVAGEEVVFGSAQHHGPRVFVRMASGFVEFSPSLPPTTPTTFAVFETILLADMDGDGDRDIVHEHRVLFNEGGCAWTEGPSFSHLVSVTTKQITSIDYDADGDRDLVLSGINNAILLENTSSGFVDVSATTIPPLSTWGARELSVADVDLDGLEDILAAKVGDASLLRNVGGTFVHEAAAANHGVLIDTDHDGRADVFNGRTVQANLHTNLHAKYLAAPGTMWQLDLQTWRIGVTAQVGFIGIGVQEKFVIYPGIGRLYLDSLFADVVSMPMVAGTAQRTFAIPSNPVLLGTTIIAQALVVDDERLQLSNPVRDRIR